MWTIEVAYRYTSVISRLMFGHKEEAEAARDSLAAEIGKDRFSNDKHKVVRIADLHGTVDFVCEEVKAVRCYDIDSWDSVCADRDAAIKKKLQDRGLVDERTMRKDNPVDMP